MKIKQLFSVVIIFVLINASFFSANAEVTADAYIQSVSASWYFFNQDNVITEVYNFLDSSSSIGDSYSAPMQFRNVDGYFAILFTFDFADSSLMLGQTYSLEFDINTSQNYIYTYYTPHYVPLDFSKSYFKVGDPRFFPWQINKAFAEDSLSDDMKKDLQSSSFNSVTHVSFPISIPSDAVSVRDGYVVSDRFAIWSYVTFWGNDDYLLPSTLDISNIRLVPTGATEYLYQDKIFQDDVIGSDEDGNESGLKGILKKISELPLQIWSIITDLGDRIGDWFSSVIDIFTGEGESYDSIEDESAIDDYLEAESDLNKDYSGDLQEQFDVAGDIFSDNSAYSFISDLFQEMLLDNVNINSLILFALAIGLCVLILGRRLNA